MAKRYGFFNSINGDRKYLATDLSQAFDVGISTGLKADNADNFKIVPNANMQVKMMSGGAMVFGHYLLDEEEEIINLDMADAELNRIDRIVLRYDKFERSIKTVIIKGTTALTPTSPAVLRTAEQYDLVLADIRINKAVTSITESLITDMRESELCGFIGVKGAVSQIDFDAHVAELAGKHITESASNENGSYIEFDDGTLICTRSFDEIAVSIPNGNVKVLFDNLPFPKDFISQPSLSMSGFVTDAGGAPTSIKIDEYHNNQTIGTVAFKNNSGITVTRCLNLNYIAIGRCK